MAQAILNTSTLSEAIDDEADSFTVGSTSNITVGQLLVICGTAGKEAVKVQTIPVAGRVNVVRGVNGTRALSHKSGTRFFIGDGDDFINIKDSSPNQYISLTGSPGTGIIDYALPGSRARDGAGNEYVCVELTETVLVGAGVFISRDGLFTAAIITSTGQGPVGVMVEGASSDQYAWAQIYGTADPVKLVGGSSLLTSLGEFQGATSVSTPSVGILGRSSSQRSSDYGALSTIQGMFPNAIPTTASTSASSETGYRATAFLNYPYVMRILTT
jgi:hypothetical protein